MRIESLTLENIRSYEGATTIKFSPTINLLLGPNNSGKSTVLSVLKMLQGENSQLQAPRARQLIRVSKNEASYIARFSQLSREFRDTFQVPPDWRSAAVQILLKANQQLLYSRLNEKDELHNGPTPIGRVLSALEPSNVFYYYLSTRKPYSYQGQIGRNAEFTVRDSLNYLPAKIDKNASLGHPNALKYQTKLEDIVGTKLCAIGGQNQNEKVAGAYTRDADHFIELEDMGTGVPQVAGLLADLVAAKEKIFLIEEPENDLHPAALIKLLAEIRSAAVHNQFIITSGIYRATSWVRVDAGQESQKVVERLRTNYKNLPDDRFGTWEKERFEDYYPKEFSEEVAKIADITDWQEKSKAKGRLAEAVSEWANANSEVADAHFRAKAQDIIECLRAIDSVLNESVT